MREREWSGVDGWMLGKKILRDPIHIRKRPPMERDLGPLSAKKRRRTAMAIRVRSTFPPSQRMRRGIEPFVAGNDDRRNGMGGWDGGSGKGRKGRGRTVALLKKILLWVVPGLVRPKLPRMKGGKKSL